MNSSVAVPPQAEDIRFTPLSKTEWRVSDRRHPDRSVDSLLGFVARQGEFYYATRMDRPREAAPMSSLDHVAHYFCH